MKISSVSIAQSRQTSFQLEASELDSHIQNMRFQSPNRVKPLSNQEKIDEVTRRFRVSIAQSRQTSFQRYVRNRPDFDNDVSIAQSRQTSFQRRENLFLSLV